jgi:hypothetical protein
VSIIPAIGEAETGRIVVWEGREIARSSSKSISWTCWHVPMDLPTKKTTGRKSTNQASPLSPKKSVFLNYSLQCYTLWKRQSCMCCNDKNFYRK